MKDSETFCICSGLILYNLSPEEPLSSLLIPQRPRRTDHIFTCLDPLDGRFKSFVSINTWTGSDIMSGPQCQECPVCPPALIPQYNPHPGGAGWGAPLA